MTKASCVLDTNVYISATLFGGNPRKVLQLARKRAIQNFTSLDTLIEISNKFHQKFKFQEEDVSKILKGISRLTTIVKPKIKLTVVKTDPSDNKILACAHAANANYIITGDSHLLNLKRFKATKIITPTDFLKLFYSRSPRT